MSNRSRLYTTKLITTLTRTIPGYFKSYWNRGIYEKSVVITTVVLATTVAGMYGIARWYIASQADKPLIVGTSFIPAYAQSFGLDAEETMDAMIDDLGVRHFRLVSYWNQLEPSPGQYDFNLLDWQFKKAEQSGSKVSLALGLRQPRWPECHMPKWAEGTPHEVWQPQLEAFIAATVNRYKDSPALMSYQVENEYFLRGFGICPDFRRERLVSEYNLVKELDPNHPIVINRSNNALGWPINEPTPDLYGISIYKRVWDAGKTKRYLEYPFPAWFYGFTAGWQQMMTGRNMIIHELQAEAWPPNHQGIQETSLEEQNKSFNAEMFKDRIEFGKDTGMREMYLWGSEYWYYRLIKLDDPSLWNVAQRIYDEN